MQAWVGLGKKPNAQQGDAQQGDSLTQKHCALKAIAIICLACPNRPDTSNRRGLMQHVHLPLCRCVYRRSPQDPSALRLVHTSETAPSLKQVSLEILPGKGNMEQ